MSRPVLITGGRLLDPSRELDGPGELLMPMYVTLLSDESIMVTDMSRAAAVLYDAGLEFLEERRGWPGLVPLDAVGTDSGDFVAMFMDIDRDPDDPGDSAPMKCLKTST